MSRLEELDPLMALLSDSGNLSFFEELRTILEEVNSPIPTSKESEEQIRSAPSTHAGTYSSLIELPHLPVQFGDVDLLEPSLVDGGNENEWGLPLLADPERLFGCAAPCCTDISNTGTFFSELKLPPFPVHLHHGVQQQTFTGGNGTAPNSPFITDVVYEEGITTASGSSSVSVCRSLDLKSCDSGQFSTTVESYGTPLFTTTTEGFHGCTDLVFKEGTSSNPNCQTIDLTSSDSEPVSTTAPSSLRKRPFLLPGMKNRGNSQQNDKRTRYERNDNKSSSNSNSNSKYRGLGSSGQKLSLFLLAHHSATISVDQFLKWYPDAPHFYTDLADYVFRANATSTSTTPLEMKSLDFIKDKFRTYQIPVWFKGQLRRKDGTHFSNLSAEPLLRYNSRSDYTLINVGPKGTKGIQAWRVGRVLVLFDLPFMARDQLFDPVIEQRLPSHFAYVEWFTPFELVPNNPADYQISSIPDGYHDSDGGRLPGYGVVPHTDIKMKVELRQIRMGCGGGETGRCAYLVDVRSVRGVIDC